VLPILHVGLVLNPIKDLLGLFILLLDYHIEVVYLLLVPTLYKLFGLLLVCSLLLPDPTKERVQLPGKHLELGKELLVGVLEDLDGPVLIFHFLEELLLLL